MPVVSSKKILEISQASNPRLALTKAVGDLSQEVVLADLVLVATYIRPEKTAGGIIRPLDNIKEDEFQGKVGLVLKMGSEASAPWEEEGVSQINTGDWVVYSIKDGWSVTINEVACRLIPYPRLRMKISHPDVVF